jgi:hypothetical protein
VFLVKNRRDAIHLQEELEDALGGAEEDRQFKVAGVLG